MIKLTENSLQEIYVDGDGVKVQITEHPFNGRFRGLILDGEAKGCTCDFMEDGKQMFTRIPSNHLVSLYVSPAH